jgi:Ser/Thr protein kinase RdoA (MazF antagonist)
LTDDELLDVARRALREYDIAARDIRPIRFVNNAVFEVVAGERFALRVHRPEYRTPTEIRSELEFVRALRRELRGTRVEVPQPVATRSGELVVEGERCCDLLTWVDGHELKPTRGLGPSSSRLLGEGLARLHDVAARFEPPPGFELPEWDVAALFSAASPFRPGPLEEFLPPEALDVFREVAERTQAALARLERTRESWGIIHADYVLVNCRFTRRRDGWRLGILDFDDLGWGSFLYDLAPILGNFLDFPGSYASHRRAFLAGYRSVRELPRSLERHLPVLMAARHASTLTWLAGLHRTGRTELDVARFVEYRVSAIRECLALLAQ